MPDNRRNPVPGGTYVFIANLLNRASDLEVARIDVLREAVRTTRAQAPFHIRHGALSGRLDRREGVGGGRGTKVMIRMAARMNRR